jgi:hypothetical protein
MAVMAVSPRIGGPGAVYRADCGDGMSAFARFNGNSLRGVNLAQGRGLH